MSNISHMCDELVVNLAKDLPITHKFAPGVYYREIFMPGKSAEYPRGLLVVGKKHKTSHMNVILSGRALVLMGGVVREITAPQSFMSEAGVRKVLWILEDMIWATIHPTDETDIFKLEQMLVETPDEITKGEVLCLLQQ